ncbi:MAG: DUF4365 domain-containing protein [Patescibacteria group bacterium]
MAVPALELATNRPIQRLRTTFFPRSLGDNERGRLMQHRVASILLGLDTVKVVIVNPKDRHQDRFGRDLTVHLADGSPMDLVWVQVKSSPKWVYEYLKTKGAHLKKNGDNRSVRQWMKDNHQIILNGSKDDALVEADFNSQLAAIQEHQREASVNTGMSRFSLRY